MFKLPKENIQVSRTLLGGGFGRRLVADFALQAALISKAVARPVKVVWSREEDMQHDIYRPATLHRITAGINEYGKLRAISHRLVSPSILQYVFAPAVTDVYDPSCLEGLVESHYDVPNVRVDFKLLHIPVPTSVLRTRAREMGMRTLREDGTRKVLAGLTTAEEVIRSTVGDAED